MKIKKKQGKPCKIKKYFMKYFSQVANSGITTKEDLVLFEALLKVPEELLFS